MRPRRRSALPSWAASIKRNKNTVILSHALFAKQSVQPIVRQSTENLISLLNQESPRGCSTAKASLCFHVTAQVDSRPSRAPITFGAVTKAVCTVPCAALGQETPLPHRGLCGPLSPTAAGFWRAVTKVVRHSGPHSPLCGSGSGDAPSAQGTVRTPFADSRVRPHSLGSVGKVRINARPPHPTPSLESPCFPPWTKATLPPQSEFSIKFGFLRVTCAFADSFFHPEQLPDFGWGEECNSSSGGRRFR